jgi:hypothetical protein
VGWFTTVRRTLKRSGYAQKSPLKGLSASPFSGLSGFLPSRQISTGGADSGPCTAVTFPEMPRLPSRWRFHANRTKLIARHNQIQTF